MAFIFVHIGRLTIRGELCIRGVPPRRLQCVFYRSDHHSCTYFAVINRLCTVSKTLWLRSFLRVENDTMWQYHLNVVMILLARRFQSASSQGAWCKILHEVETGNYAWHSRILPQSHVNTLKKSSCGGRVRRERQINQNNVS